MDTIARQQEIYGRVWFKPEYRVKCHGLDLWKQHRDIFPGSFESALDIGCGRGLLMAHLNDMGIDAWGFDIADNCLDESVRGRWGYKFIKGCLWQMDLGWQFDLGICTDVMEHIPEEHVPAALERIGSHCYRVIFKIANIPSKMLGYNLHPTRKPSEWWQEQIASIGGSLEKIFIPTNREEYIFKWKTS